MDRNAESIGGGDAPLFHGDRSEARKSDDIADSENVGLLCAVIVIDGNATTRVGLETGGGKIYLVDVALPPHRIQQCVAGNFFLALQYGGNSVVGSFFDAFDLFVQAHGDAAVTQVVTERLHHFGVGEFEQAR